MRAGIIKISDKILLDQLQFPNGEIRRIKESDYPGTFEILLEDEEMPELKPNELPQVVLVSYTTYQNCNGEKVAIREKIVNP